MSKLPRAHAPGEVWNYSTGETNLIGILVMEATNKSLSSYLSEKVWVPFGMLDEYLAAFEELSVEKALPHYHTPMTLHLPGQFTTLSTKDDVRGFLHE